MSQDGVDDFTGGWHEGVSYARAIGKAPAGCVADALHWPRFNFAKNRDTSSPEPIPKVLREASDLKIVTNGGFARGARAEATLTSGAANLVGIGWPMFAHPDWSYIIGSGAPYDWTAFTRKYAIRPPLDCTLAYQTTLEDPHWPPKW